MNKQKHVQLLFICISKSPPRMSRLKFEQELEFVQFLCSPDYLRWLVQEGYFESPEFREYIKYLEYWKRPEYLRFLAYPQCLAVLNYLNSEDANTLLDDEVFLSSLGEQQYFIWLNKHKRGWDTRE